MGKINIDRASDYSQLRVERKSDGRKSSKITTRNIESKPPVNQDKLEISGRGNEVGKLVDRIKELPDVRAEKIKSLRDQIIIGDYNPPGDKIADAILTNEKL